MDATHKVLDMMARWDALGQGFFLLVLAMLVIGGGVHVIKTLLLLPVCLLHGWKPVKSSDPADDDDDDDDE